MGLDGAEAILTPPRSGQQRRLRRILALPPHPRAPAAPRRHGAGQIHTRGL